MNPRLSRILTIGSLLVGCALYLGCASPMRYSQYTGNDTSSFWGTWPVGGGSMAETAYAVPVYRGWPERPYQVLGSVSFQDPRKRWNQGIIDEAAKEAKRHKADAIVIRQGAEFGVSKIADAKNDPMVLSSAQTTALAVRWLTQAEIGDQERLVDELLKRFSVNQPSVTANRSVGQLVIISLLQSGLRLDSPELFNRFNATMEKLLTHSPESIAGEWIHKGTESLSSIFSAGRDQNFIGLSSVSVEGENVTIVSSSGTMELNFTGTLSKGRLSGQIGIGGVAMKCEGAATPEKISISFQCLTSDGTVSGNVVFQRLTPKSNPNEQTKPNSPGSRT